MKIVFPVRFAAHQGAAVQTTSAEMTDSRMLLMCPQHRAPAAALVALQLYLPDSFPPAAAMGRIGAPAGKRRSEEHTSELQSRLHLVCRLLLEKKKDQATIVPVSITILAHLT